MAHAPPWTSITGSANRNLSRYSPFAFREEYHLCDVPPQHYGIGRRSGRVLLRVDHFLSRVGRSRRDPAGPIRKNGFLSCLLPSIHAQSCSHDQPVFLGAGNLERFSLGSVRGVVGAALEIRATRSGERRTAKSEWRHPVSNTFSMLSWVIVTVHSSGNISQ